MSVLCLLASPHWVGSGPVRLAPIGFLGCRPRHSSLCGVNPAVPWRVSNRSGVIRLENEAGFVPVFFIVEPIITSFF